ncbi:hypothetical protein [Engelhardtia mirabilis]|uniref:hypothetical protein n=1 Tax=Engelhardtia mirabilis TaxID=2528011 RepID=UPI0011A76236
MDIVTALYLAGQELATALELSLSETKASVDRGVAAGILGPGVQPKAKPSVIRGALLEFLTHGARYAYFVSPGRVGRGLPTGRSAPPLSDLDQPGSDPPLVWADPDGEVRGQVIEPLYRTVPAIARKDPAMYELLALVDGVRCGATRERGLAVAELERRRLHDPN